MEPPQAAVAHAASSPAERALALPLIAERVAHFLLELEPDLAALARAESCCKALRAALTPRWRALCQTLSPGILSLAEQPADGYACWRGVRYRQLYWQLHDTQKPAPLRPRATYTFVADVAFHSGKRTSTFSAAFSAALDDLCATDPLGSGVTFLLTQPMRQTTSANFLFTAGDMCLTPDGREDNVTCTLRVYRNDGAVACLQPKGGILGACLGLDKYEDGDEMRFSARAAVQLRFLRYLSSWDVEVGQVLECNVLFTLHLGVVDEPLLYYDDKECAEWRAQRARRLRVIEHSQCSRDGPRLRLGLARSKKELAESVALALEQLAWARPGRPPAS
jgi:hypothetical protein